MGNFACFCRLLILFSKLKFQIKSFGNKIRLSNRLNHRLNPDDPGLSCLQMRSADDKNPHYNQESIHRLCNAITFTRKGIHVPDVWLSTEIYITTSCGKHEYTYREGSRCFEMIMIFFFIGCMLGSRKIFSEGIQL